MTKMSPRSARFENEAGPCKTKRGVQMAVHEQKISKILGLYDTRIPANSRLGLRSPNVEHNKIFCEAVQAPVNK